MRRGLQGFTEDEKHQFVALMQKIIETKAPDKRDET